LRIHVVNSMVSMVTAGIMTVAVISIMLFAVYAALYPPQLEITVGSNASEPHDITVVLKKAGEEVKSWHTSALMKGKSSSFSYPTDMGGWDIVINASGIPNATFRVEVPFFVLDKALKETFTVENSGVVQGKFY